MPSDPPLFAVIMPTRNRASLFATALQSVLEQDFDNYEIIVVNDGSSSENDAQYRKLVEGLPRVKMLTLSRREQGHGQSYTLNQGAAEARATYLCFLDDDDQWTDPQHLGRTARVISVGEIKPDLVLANQQAYRGDMPAPGAVWVEDLRGRLAGAPDPGGAYVVTPAQLLRCPAHCHLNTTVVLRDLYLQIGGLDEGLRYECDRDFYLRAIDQARSIRYIPHVVSRHNIPDPAAKANMSTIESELSKRLSQLRVFDKAALFSARPELREYAMRQRAYVLKHIATEAARLGRLDCAAYYAREALITQPTLGWLGVTALYALRRPIVRATRALDKRSNRVAGPGAPRTSPR